MQNMPVVNLGIVAVSRSCFPASLSTRRRKAVVAAYGAGLYECPIIVETETDVKTALDDLQQHGVNALVVYLGNFGPEGPETLFAKLFSGPVMYAAAAEGDGDLINGRGDAFCGLLNCSYNLGLRNARAYIPANPVGSAEEIALRIQEFVPVARAVLGLSHLKIIAFGPRPDDFLACNAPIKPLYDLGVAIEENSELDLYAAFRAHENDSRIPAVVEDMLAELGENCRYREILPRLAQYELTLLDWAEAHKGLSSYVVFANKCWPAFQTEFGFTPCYINSRLSARGIPVGCETDIYGALSEYIGQCVSDASVTLLDINNTVPKSMYEASIQNAYDIPHEDTFMGFHCGNTCTSLLCSASMGYHIIMKRNLEPDLEQPNVTRGTLEGNIRPGNVTVFRLQSTADCHLKAYAAQGQVLDVDCESFGAIGVISIPEMRRFYRNVLITKRFPHHAAVAFGHHGQAIFDVLQYLGVSDISFNQPRHMLYPAENPFA